MEIVLNICISDGSEILVDGFDEISFYNEVPNSEIEHSGYSWEKDYYYELLNALSTYNFIGIKRNDDKDVLDYKDHSFVIDVDEDLVRCEVNLAPVGGEV